MDSTITLRKYIEKGKTFVIPSYQRGYIWGKRKSNPEDIDSVSYILNSIFSKLSNCENIFLQGVTVSENKDTITLIDGQQRTTFLFILLKLLGYNGSMKIKYEIRAESQTYLDEIKGDDDFSEKEYEEFQDIYYFKKTARLIKHRLALENLESSTITEYLLDNIRFLYINIPESQAKKVFTMMNGNRAKMLESEIIKAELLRLVSLPSENNQNKSEWELNMLRSRYAREWDRWIHWWNREEVKKAFKTETQLGWLLVAAMPEEYNNPQSVTFESFRKEIGLSSKKSAMEIFYQLRQTQKRFEDTFFFAKRHNMIGAILRISSEKTKFIKYYFSGKPIDDESLYRYYLCSFIRMTHDMIVDKDGKFAQSFVEHYNKTLSHLKKPLIYEDKESGDKESAFHLLLRLNIDEDNRQNKGLGRRFDFSIWDDGVRSLEHIYPKSCVHHLDEDTGKLLNGNNDPVYINDDSVNAGNRILKRDEINPIVDEFPLIDAGDQERPKLIATEHCIGNLVLLYRDDNSSFNASDFHRKKEIFLVGEEKKGHKELFKSRHLLHTIYHFAESEWGAKEISKYFRLALQEFCKVYNNIKNSLPENC